MSDEIHKGDVGTTFRMQLLDSSTAVDLSSSTYTSIIFAFKQPDGSVTSVTATAMASASTGIVDYTVSAATFLNTIGSWEVQAIVGVASNTWNSSIHKFIVYPNL